MSTEEIGEEVKKGEGEGNENSEGEDWSWEEEASRIRLPEKLQMPPAITKTVVTTTTKTKVIGFDDYNTDIRSSDSYITIEAGITAVEFAGKEVALKSVLKMFWVLFRNKT